MRTHKPQRSSAAASATLLARRAVDLLVSRIVTETLTAPCRHVLLLRQPLLHHATSPWDLDLQPLEKALVGPVRIAPAPVALLRSLPLRATPPLVVGAVALPTETRVGGVVQTRHLEGSPRSKPEGYIRRRPRRPCDHTGVSVGEGLVQTRPLHPILDGPNRLLHVEPRAPKPSLLLSEVVELLLDLDLELELLTKPRHLRVNARVFQASQRLVDGVRAWVLSRELENLRVSKRDGEVCQVWSGQINRRG